MKKLSYLINLNEPNWLSENMTSRQPKLNSKSRLIPPISPIGLEIQLHNVAIFSSVI